MDINRDEQYESQNIINQEKYAKYKESFDKHKNENNKISDKSLNDILNDYGNRLTLEQTQELIKQVTGKSDKTEINFDEFVKIMEKENNDDEGNNKIKIPKSTLYLVMIICMLAGAVCTIINKIQQNVKAKGVLFEGHQPFMAFCMFLGELLCLLFYFINEKYTKIGITSELLTNRGVETKEKKEPKIWLFIVPAFLDLLTSTLGNIGLTFLNTSVYQMLRGSIIVFSCIATIIFLRTRYYRHHFLGIFIIICGLCTVGLNAVTRKKDKSGKKPALGVILVIISQIISSLHLIAEEKITKEYEISPIKAIGYEGMWGSGMYIILLFIFQFIKCNNISDIKVKESLCISEAEKDDYRFENTIFAFEQMFSKGILILYILIYILAVAFFNSSGLTIAKYVTSTLRAMIDPMKTLLVWLFFLIMPFVPKATEEEFSWIQLLGFAIIILGEALYNEFLVLPFWKFSKNTKKNIEKRKKIENELLEMNTGLLTDK